MKNSTSQTSILKDTAVFDYVAGEQSDGARKNFEKLLKQDGGLAQEVEIEKLLRSSLEGINGADAEPISMNNFDALLERIESVDNELGSTDAEVLSNNAGSRSDEQSNVIVAQPWRWQRQFNIAASFAVIAMIGIIGFNQTTQPDFVTLSDKTASVEVDFAGLVDQRRLVRLELSNGLAASEIDELLEGFQLKAIQSGTTGQVVLASANQSVGEQKITDLVTDKRIINAELVSFGTE